MSNLDFKLNYTSNKTKKAVHLEDIEYILVFGWLLIIWVFLVFLKMYEQHKTHTQAYTTHTDGGGWGADKKNPTYIVCEYNSQFPDLILHINGVQSDNRRRKDSQRMRLWHTIRPGNFLQNRAFEVDLAFRMNKRPLFRPCYLNTFSHWKNFQTGLPDMNNDK